MMGGDSSLKDYFMATKWAALAQEVGYLGERLDIHLHEVGVRDRRDVPGDKLGDSPEASLVRVHARAALGALEHLASSLDTLADLIDPDAQAGS